MVSSLWMFEVRFGLRGDGGWGVRDSSGEEDCGGVIPMAELQTLKCLSLANHAPAILLPVTMEP